MYQTVPSISEEQLWTSGGEIYASKWCDVEGPGVVWDESEESIPGILKVSMPISIRSNSWLGPFFCLDEGSCCCDLVHFYRCENGLERLSVIRCG